MISFSSSRRRFIASTGAWIGASAIGFGLSSKNTRTISLLHTTDLHGHIVPTQTYGGVKDLGGLARCATRIRQWRAENPDNLLVDIGDVYQGTPESLANNGNLMIDLFNALDYDAWVLGNHDFDWGPQALAHNLARSQSPVLTANLTIDGKPTGGLPGPWGKVRPWMIREIAGFRIALIGLITPGLPYWLTPGTLGPAAPVDPVETLRKIIPDVHAANPDAIVLLTHMGWRERGDDYANPLKKIIENTPGIDALLAGHSHRDQPSWEINDTLCSQASYYGINCGKLDLTFDTKTRKLIGKRAITELMDHQVALDPAVMKLAAPEINKSEKRLSRQLGTVTQTITERGNDATLAPFLCKAFATALKNNGTPVDGVFHGTFGTGDIPAGPITERDCWKYLPYENLLTTAEITGAEIIEICRHSYGRILWPFILELDSDGNPTRIELNGKPVSKDTRYTIAFNSYDAQSGGKRLMKLREILSHPASKRKTHLIDTRTALIETIKERKQIP
ncbi:MAG: bifunctional metallophosphatase/5'-nucleotidase [Verrucomicrobiales bacterium]